jgi:hypothetical protein
MELMGRDPQKKLSVSDSHPPLGAARKRDSGERTMGVSS